MYPFKTLLLRLQLLYATAAARAAHLQTSVHYQRSEIQCYENQVQVRLGLIVCVAIVP